VWIRSGRETRPHAFDSVGGESELRDQQQFAFDIGQAQIHLSGIVGKNAVTQQTIRQADYLRVPVSSLDRDQGQQAEADPGNVLTVYSDLGTRGALDNRDHIGRQ
jgi:hypothetical protein